MTIDWVNGPSFQRMVEFTLPKYETAYLNNGMKVLILNQGSVDIFKIDLVFRGGRFFEKKKMAAKLTSALMREGTSKNSSSQLAESLDFFGASMRTEMSMDHGSISVSGLTKHMDGILDKVLEILCNPIFPNEEIEKYKKNYASKLKHDLSKNDIICFRLLTEQLFGADTPYGYNSSTLLLDEVTQDDLMEFYHSAYGVNNAYMIVCGKLPKNIIEILNKHFDQFNKKSVEISSFELDFKNTPTSVNFKTKNELQTSLSIGRRLFNRHHEDFASFFAMSTILGGYFGSRLMTVIREEKGLTYDISAMTDHMISTGYFNIDTDVDPKNIGLVKKEIYEQIDILQNELVKDDELNMVKNYLIGNFLNLVDGPLNSAGFLRSLELDGFSEDKFLDFVSKLSQLDSNKVREMAQLYLNQKDMIEIEVGA